MQSIVLFGLEELHALGTNSFNTASDTAALTAEATKLIAEMTRITTSAEWKGNDIIGTSNSIGFGRNGGTLDVTLTAFTLPKVQVGTWPDGALTSQWVGVTKIDNTPSCGTISVRHQAKLAMVSRNYSGAVPADKLFIGICTILQRQRHFLVRMYHQEILTQQLRC